MHNRRHMPGQGGPSNRRSCRVEPLTAAGSFPEARVPAHWRCLFRTFVGLWLGLGAAAEGVWSLQNELPAGQFGHAVAAGDVNGDGFQDVLIGARVHPRPYWRTGRALLFYGSRSGPQPTPAWTREGSEPEERLGESVACADVNGDGFADLLVGSWMLQNRRGAVWLFLGSKRGPSASPDWQVEGEVEGLCYGRGLCAAGDVNADGYADVLIGAPFFSQTERRPGRVDLFLGGPAGLKPKPDWSFTARQHASSLGIAVAAAGDVNGDGYAGLETRDTAD